MEAEISMQKIAIGRGAVDGCESVEVAGAGVSIYVASLS